MSLADAVAANHDPVGEALVAAMSERLKLRNVFEVFMNEATRVLRSETAAAQNRTGASRALMGMLAAIGTLDEVVFGSPREIWLSIDEANFIKVGVLASIWGVEPPPLDTTGIEIRGRTVH
jgi:hypothetical protein